MLSATPGTHSGKTPFRTFGATMSRVRSKKAPARRARSGWPVNARQSALISVSGRWGSAGALRGRGGAFATAALGRPQGFRRRTPGLGREEVAILAGVGTTWYTWLEQGRDVRPSNEVLSGLAVALRLVPTARR